jgi:hypothetical protein
MAYIEAVLSLCEGRPKYSSKGPVLVPCAARVDAIHGNSKISGMMQVKSSVAGHLSVCPRSGMTSIVMWQEFHRMTWGRIEISQAKPLNSKQIEQYCTLNITIQYLISKRHLRMQKYESQTNL